MPVRVLIVEASSGGVVGGSLTGFLHYLRGVDRSRIEPSMALYEPKTIESELADLSVPVHHVRRRRLPKEHSLLRNASYQRAKAFGAVKGTLRAVRQTSRLIAEETPAALQLARVVRSSKAQVIHLGNGVRANFDGILAGMLTGVPVVCHVKGFEKYGGRERWAARRLACLVSMTEAIAAHCREKGVVAPHNQVIYDAVDLEWLKPSRSREEVRRELGVGADQPLLLISGNIQEWKGQAVLVEAMGRITGEFPDAVCLMAGGVHRAGEAYCAAMRERIGELGMEERVRLLGFRTDVPDLINAVDIVVHASVRPEPFGRVILEGMLAGKLVIATDAGGVRELIEHDRTGRLVPPGDSDALAACLRASLRNPTRSTEIGRSARDWASRKFSLKAHVDAMSTLYERTARN
jgi:glycosyltransferase involved in cell wall biosynthesis